MRTVFSPLATAARIVTGESRQHGGRSNTRHKEGDRVGAAPLTPGSWHAERTPDAPAIIMGTSVSSSRTPSWRIAHPGSPARCALRACARATRSPSSWRTTGSTLRSRGPPSAPGLRYTAINNHLRPAEAQYVLDDCGAVALFSSEAMGDVVGRLDLSVIPLQVCASGRLPGFRRYGDFLSSAEPDRLRTSARAGRCSTPPAPPAAQGVRKQLPGTALATRRPRR